MQKISFKVLLLGATLALAGNSTVVAARDWPLTVLGMVNYSIASICAGNALEAYINYRRSSDNQLYRHRLSDTKEGDTVAKNIGLCLGTSLMAAIALSNSNNYNNYNSHTLSRTI